MDKVRLDVLLAERGLVESRALAQRLVMAGQVRVDGQVELKASAAVLPEAQVRQAELATALARVDPGTLYAGAVQVLLHPSVRSLGPVFISQLERALIGAPLPLGQSVLLAWPQTVALLAGTSLLFALAYVVFQRREIRA